MIFRVSDYQLTEKEGYYCDEAIFFILFFIHNSSKNAIAKYKNYSFWQKIYFRINCCQKSKHKEVLYIYKKLT